MANLSPWRFVVTIWLIDAASLFPIFAIATLLDKHYHFLGTGRSLEDTFGGPLGLFFVAVIIAPWVETFIGQALPSTVTRKLRLPPVFFLIVSTVWFAWLHGLGFHGPDFWLMVLGHLVAAFLLAYTYLVGRKHSRWRAVWMTASVHTLANFGVGAAFGIFELAERV